MEDPGWPVAFASRGPVRRGLIIGFVALAGCASASVPPGGPEDKIAPKLVRLSPDTNSVNVVNKVVQFYFDETINDRGTGAQELDNFFLVSPSDGAAHLSWHRSRIDIADIGQLATITVLNHRLDVIARNTAAAYESKSDLAAQDRRTVNLHR